MTFEASNQEQTNDISLDGQMNADGNQFLTFILAGEEYGVDILRVQEIKGWDDATEIPNTPEFIQGVMNLRGTIVPIIDLRIRFNLPKVEYSNMTVVVVLNTHSDKGERTMGFVVDAVSEVYNVSNEELKDAPDFGGSIDTQFINGLATVDEKMLILLDIDRLVDVDVIDSKIAH